MLYNNLLTFTRKTPTTPVKGVYSFTSVTYNAFGNMQPASADDLLKLPEGLRNKDTKLFISRTIIQLNDYTTINGQKYQAMNIEDFTGNTGVGQCEVLLVKGDV